ncbi:unnamed protein product [marine sediment metagenome]|uniref:DUF503 domain-containing protein n=1 Tax=marine sediment metagenome TaxID=412755 RepID=X1ASV2_9ZZZZ
MIIAIVEIDLFLPYCHSLKEKRSIIKSLIDSLGKKNNISIKEINYKDLWQRSLLGITSICDNTDSAKKFLDMIKNKIYEKEGTQIIKFNSSIHLTE